MLEVCDEIRCPNIHVLLYFIADEQQISLRADNVHVA